MHILNSSLCDLRHLKSRFRFQNDKSFSPTTNNELNMEYTLFLQIFHTYRCRSPVSPPHPSDGGDATSSVWSGFRQLRYGLNNLQWKTVFWWYNLSMTWSLATVERCIMLQICKPKLMHLSTHQKDILPFMKNLQIGRGRIFLSIGSFTSPSSRSSSCREHTSV